MILRLTKSNINLSALKNMFSKYHNDPLILKYMLHSDIETTYLIFRRCNVYLTLLNIYPRDP